MTYPKPCGVTPLAIGGDHITQRIREMKLAEAQAAWRDQLQSPLFPGGALGADELIAEIHSGRAWIEGNTKDGLWYVTGPHCGSR